MVGHEIAQLLEPFAKWGIVVAGVLFAVWLVRFWIRQGAKDAERLDSLENAGVERQDATDDLRRTRRRMRSAWRRVRDRQGGRDSAA
jgi:hypothetical protein